MNDHSKYGIVQSGGQLGVYPNAEISSKKNYSAIAPVIEFQFGDAGLTRCRPVGPALHFHSIASNGIRKILRNRGRRSVIANYASVSQKDRKLAEMLNHRHIVTDKKNRAAFCCGHTIHFSYAFVLKVSVSDGKNLVDYKDLRFQKCCHREGEANVHAR